MIETRRLIIRPLSYNELKIYCEDSVLLAKEMNLNVSNSLVNEETQEAIKNDLLPFLVDSNKYAFFYTIWIIIEKVQNSIIGGICFHGKPDKNGEVEIGYGIDEEFRNNGYMTETLNAMLNWLKENKEIMSVKAETNIENVSSIKVLEKNEFFISEKSENSVIYRFELRTHLTHSPLESNGTEIEHYLYFLYLPLFSFLG